MMDCEPKENSELLDQNHKDDETAVALDVKENLNKEDLNKHPPDGGFKAYSVLVGSFLTNGLLFGVINSYSVIYNVLEQQLKNNNVNNSESRASLVGALTIGTTFFLSPLSGMLTGIMGLRMTAVLGGAVATVGLIISSFVTDYVDVLCFTYGIMYGLGASLAYTPSLAILGHYFKKYLGIVNGVVTVGSSIFTVIMPPLMDYILMKHGLEWLFRILAFSTLSISICGLLFTPIPLITTDKTSKEDSNFKSLVKAITNIWKNRKYKSWALSMPIALFGYFVPYVHLRELIEINFKDVTVNLPLQCMAVTSGVGRLIFGALADKPGIDRILLQQISFYVIGTLTIILPFVQSFELLVAVSLGMGLFDGAFIALIGPIAFELCGSMFAAQAIGFMLGLAATPLCIGPPLAGYLFSLYGTYKLAFVLAGISPLVGATLMFAVRLTDRKPRKENETSNGHIMSPDFEKLQSFHGGSKEQTSL